MGENGRGRPRLRTIHQSHPRDGRPRRWLLRVRRECARPVGVEWRLGWQLLLRDPRQARNRQRGESERDLPHDEHIRGAGRCFSRLGARRAGGRPRRLRLDLAFGIAEQYVAVPALEPLRWWLLQLELEARIRAHLRLRLCQWRGCVRVVRHWVRLRRGHRWRDDRRQYLERRLHRSGGELPRASPCLPRYRLPSRARPLREHHAHLGSVRRLLLPVGGRLQWILRVALVRR